MSFITIKSKPFFFLILIILIQVAAWLLLKPVWPFSDDYCYAVHANDFLSAHFHLSQNEFQNRFGVYIPVSFFFRCFGINPYTISIWPLLAGIFMNAVIFMLLAKTENASFAFAVCVLLSLNILQITYSIALFPDLIVACFSTTAILLTYYGRTKKPDHSLYPFLAVLFLFLGVLTKITILLVLPFFLLLFCMDCISALFQIFWKRFFLSAVFFLFIFLMIYYVATGDAFFRFTSILNFNTKVSAYDGTRMYITEHFPASIFQWLNEEFGYLFILLFSLLMIFQLKKKHWNELPTYLSTFALLLITEYLMLFHTEKYGFLFRQDRLWMMLIAPLSMLTIYVSVKEQKGSAVLSIVLLILGILNYQFFGWRRSVLFILFSAAAAALVFFRKRPNVRFVVIIFPFLVLAINFVYGNSNYRVPALQSGNLIKQELEKLNDSKRKIILTAEDFAGTHTIYNGFKEYSHLRFYDFSDYDSLKNEELYILINAERMEVPDFVKKNPTGWLVICNEKNLWIYKSK